MAQTREGAIVVGSKILGISVEDYKAKIAAGLLWCTGCKDWHKLGLFARDSSRRRGRNQSCKAYKNRVARENYITIPPEDRKPMGPPPLTDTERKAIFWSNVDIKNLHGCWEWKAGRFSHGYGQFKMDGRHQKAHRISYAMVHGVIPQGLLVCHHCDNPPCVNPAHLFLGTHKDNSMDMAKKGRSARNINPNPGAKNGGAKLRGNQALNILNLCEAGATPAQISKAFQISKSQARNFKHRRTWKCLQV